MTTFDASNNSGKNDNEKKLIDVDSLLSNATSMIDPANLYLEGVVSIRDYVKSDSMAKVYSIFTNKIQPIVKKHSGVFFSNIDGDGVFFLFSR